MGAVRFEHVDELRNALSRGRNRRHDRRSPIARRRQFEHGVELAHRVARTGAIRFVHHEHVGDLHEARLVRLNRVAPTRVHDHHRRIGVPRHFDLDLSHPDGLHDHPVVTGGVEQARGLWRRRRQTTQVSACRHRTDEHARVGGVLLHAHPIAENRAARERARRVDGEHADARPVIILALTVLPLTILHVTAPVEERCDEPVGERRLAGAGRAGDADHPRATSAAVILRAREHGRVRRPARRATQRARARPDHRRGRAQRARRRRSRSRCSCRRTPTSRAPVIRRCRPRR